MSIQVRVDKRLLKQLREQYSNEFINEFKTTPTNSQVIMMALIHLESMKTGQEAKIKINKTGCMKYEMQ